MFCMAHVCPLSGSIPKFFKYLQIIKFFRKKTVFCWEKIPSGELTFCHGKSPFLMGKSTISMAIFNCYVSSPEGNTPRFRISMFIMFIIPVFPQIPPRHPQRWMSPFWRANAWRAAQEVYKGQGLHLWFDMV